MPLIESPRHTPEDLAAWRRWEILDRHHAAAARGRLERQSGMAADIMADFAAAGPCYVSVSWGRDSTVLADIAARHRLPIPLAYATSADVPGRIANPDSTLVRDALLAVHPHVDHHEHPCGLRGLDRYHGPRYISGVRGDESGVRRQAMRWHGHTTPSTCRPIGSWTSADIWAYLTLHDLPIHPAYAMTYGGELPRDKIRVHSFGGEDGGVHGRLQWEEHYYADVVAPLHGVTRARPVAKPS